MIMIIIILSVVLETLTSIKRAGADLILTYFAKPVVANTAVMIPLHLSFSQSIGMLT